jgi:hypothetical protein
VEIRREEWTPASKIALETTSTGEAFFASSVNVVNLVLVLF